MKALSLRCFWIVIDFSFTCSGSAVQTFAEVRNKRTLYPFHARLTGSHGQRDRPFEQQIDLLCGQTEVAASSTHWSLYLVTSDVRAIADVLVFDFHATVWLDRVHEALHLIMSRAQLAVISYNWFNLNPSAKWTPEHTHKVMPDTKIKCMHINR